MKLLRLSPISLVTAALAAPRAEAAVTCSYVDGLPLGTGNNSATVTMTAGGDTATVGVAADGVELRVNGAACSLTPVGGTRARVDNLDAVEVRDLSGSGDTAVVIVDPLSFAPGESEETDGTPEIEFEVDLGAGAGDRLVAVNGDAGSDDRVRLGAREAGAGADFNASSDQSAQDPDLRVGGAEVGFLAAGLGDDQVTAAGGSRFAACPRGRSPSSPTTGPLTSSPESAAR